MFQGERVVRFFSQAGEASVVKSVREALGGLGRVSVDRAGAIRIDTGPGSALSATSMSGRLRRRHMEYEVRLTYRCRPTPLAWAVAALGTPVLLLGWAAVLASWSARRRAA